MKTSLVLLFALFLTIACTKNTPPPKNELTVGVDGAYAPFESQTSHGDLVGFDIEIIQSLAKKMGVQIKILNTPWEGLFSQLASGDRDILISAITITEERKKSMDFSDAYFNAVQLIAVPQQSSVKSFADLKGLSIGVQTGTTGDEVVSKQLGKTNPLIKRFEGMPLTLQELSNGGVDAAIGDNGVVAHFLKNNDSKLKTVSDPLFSQESYGIAVKKGNTELLAKINKALAEIKQDGTYDRIYKSYFGSDKK